MVNSMKFLLRRSEERGNTDQGWLKAFHTFSFAKYKDRNHQQYGAVRVFNEDRVAPSMGFGTKNYHEFEMFSYIVSGELKHRDGLGNIKILKRGSVQLTSSGTGASLCDETHGPVSVHLLQLWALPSTPHLLPQYFTRHFSDSEKMNRWVRVVAPIGTEGVSAESTGDGPAPVQSPLSLYATIIGEGNRLEHKMRGKKGYLHVLQTGGYNTSKACGATVRIVGGGVVEDELLLREGDGAYMSVGVGSGMSFYLENVGDRVAEVLLLDLE